MRNLAFLALLTVSALALAGCSGDGGGDGDDPTSSSSSSSRSSSSASGTSSSTSSSSAGSSSSTSTGPAENRAPTGALSASSMGGPAPFNVTFNLTGSDPDGDTIVWDLTFGDGAATNGTNLPASPTHEYATAGVYNVTFTLTDGTDPTSYSVEINVTGEAGFVPISYSMAIVYPCPHCTAVTLIAEESVVPSPAFAAGEQGVDTIWLELTAEMVGKPFTVTSTGGDPDAIISEACTPDAAIIEGHGEGPEAGTIPAGAGCLVTWDFDTPQSTITITVG